MVITLRSIELQVCLLMVGFACVVAQTCPDGVPAAFECEKKHGKYKCPGDSTLGCEQINGVHYCCDVSVKNETEVDETGSTTPTTTTRLGSKTTTESRLERCEDNGSECRLRRYLCTNYNYKDFMERECPLTCGVCARRSRIRNKNRRTKSSDESEGQNCVDKGADCSLRSALCSHTAYLTLMKDQCPNTCDLCDA